MKQKVYLSDKTVHSYLRACLHGGGGPQEDEVTRLGGVKKNNPRLHAVLQPSHLGVQVHKITEWSLSA